jgi:hypothetical protein
MSTMFRTLAFLSAFGLATPGIGLGGQAETKADLSTIKTLKCTFSLSSRGTWKNGVPAPTINKTGLLSVEIKEINAPAGSAVVATTSGAHDVTAQLDEKTIHFLEANRGGRIAVTSVFSEYSTGTRLRATYSRHDYLPIDIGTFKSEPEIAQYYGDCEATH